MKTLMSYLVIAAMILMSSFTIHEQNELNKQNSQGCFNTLRVHRQAKNVVSTWSVNDNNVILFQVERSYDGEFFEEAGTVEYNGNAHYKHKDIGVFPGLIYYRIKAVKADGSTENSEVESIRIMARG
jgi:hypothetical protein